MRKLLTITALLIFSLEATTSIHFLENYDPTEWHHVSINFENLQNTADLFSQSEESADWASILPEDLTFEELINYLIGLIAIDFCHWEFDKTTQSLKQFYVITDKAERLRGSMAMCELAKRAYNQGVKLFEAPLMIKMSREEFQNHFSGVDEKGASMKIPMLEERVEILHEIGHCLLSKWNGSFTEILKKANQRVLNNGNGFVEILVREFPRFQDEYIYRSKKVGIYKLAQLSVMALENALQAHPNYKPFVDTEVLTLCADYQIPKGLRDLGILEYDRHLADKIEREEWLPSGSTEEIELRMASVYAGTLLKEKINSLLQSQGKHPITSIHLDYLLWSYGRQQKSKHHLTPNIMY